MDAGSLVLTLVLAALGTSVLALIVASVSFVLAIRK